MRNSMRQNNELEHRFGIPKAKPALALMIATLALAVVALPPEVRAQAMPAAAVACSGCHGTSSRNAIPVLKGHNSETIISVLQAFRSGTAESTVMGRIAKGLSDEEITAIADWYARGGVP